MPATDTSSVGWHAELADWLRLQYSDGVGPLRGRQLLDHFSTPAAIFAAAPAALAGLVPASVALALTRPPSPEDALAVAVQAERMRAWLAHPGNGVLTLRNPLYPAWLRQLPDPPLLLYLQGRVDLLAAPALAIVGSRNCSAQGAANAERFATALSQAGLTIVSGLALGIDAAAHRGGLRGPGATIAVLGTGADTLYPPSNAALGRAIAAQGCLVSEYWLGTPAMPGNFPRRNRLISGLSRGVLVVEAALGSGSLITARMAVSQNREVFAVPGSIHATLSKGCHQLLREGAKLVETAADVLSELHLPELIEDDLDEAAPTAAPLPRAAAGAGRQARLLAVLGYDPLGVDQLAQRCGLDAAAVMADLLALEMAGLIERRPGGLFQRIRPP